jgi:hypothetical protein
MAADRGNTAPTTIGKIAALRHRTRRSWALVLAAAVVAIGMLGSEAGATAPRRATADATALRLAAPALIVAPRPGALLNAPVRVVLDVRRSRSGLSVALNGLIIRRLARGRSGRRVLWLTPRRGLRFGSNVLVVRGRSPAGRPMRQELSFWVRRTRPVGAGPHRPLRVAVGGLVRLRLGANLLLGVRGGLRARWVVTPPRRPGRGLGAKRFAFRGSVLSFRASVPGLYRVRMRVGNGVLSRSASTSVCAVPARPWVPVVTSTPAAGGLWAVGLPGLAYTALPGGFAQIVIVDRACLGFVANLQASSPQDLLTRLQGLSDADLVFVVMQPTSTSAGPLSGAALATFNQAIGILGGEPLSAADGAKLGPGKFSLIGVPPSDTESQQPQGTADEAAGQTQSGFLVADPNSNYRFTDRDRVAFDLQPASQAPGTVAMTVGNHSYSVTPAASVAGGFVVLTLDRYTLAPQSGGPEIVPTDVPSDPALSTQLMQNFASELSSATADQLLFIKGFGSVAGAATFANAASTQAFNTMVQAFADIGATPDVVYKIGAGSGYWLASFGGASPLQAREASVEVEMRCNSQGQCTSPERGLSGLLERDPTSRFTPTTSTPVGAQNSTLSQLLVQPTVPWPLTTPGQRAALAWATSQITPSVGSNLRAAYWLEGWNFNWSGVASQVAGLHRPAGRSDFTDADLAAVQAQIATELRYVTTAQQYVADVSSPFTTTTALQGWDTAGRIADAIINSARPSNGDAQVIVWLAQIITDFMFVAADIPQLDEGTQDTISALADNMQAATDMEGAGAGGDDSSDLDMAVRTEADKLGGRLVTLLSKTAASLRTGVFAGLVGDWAKLGTVGRYGGCTPDGPNDPRCPTAWAWNTRIQARAGNTERIAVEREVMADILPVAYAPAWYLPTDPFYSINQGRTEANQWRCVIFPFPTNHPFSKEPNSGSTTLIDNEQSPSQYSYQLYAMGGPEGSAGGVQVRVANAKIDPTLTGSGPQVYVTDRLFNPVDAGGDATQGGLGVYPQQFFYRYMQLAEGYNTRNAQFQLSQCTA